MLARRMLLLVALLMGLGALAASMAPDRRLAEPTPSPGPQQAAPTPRGESPADRDARDLERIPGEAPLRTLDAGRSGQVVRVAVEQTLRLRVTSDQLDSVQLGDDGPIEVVTPEAPARFELLVDEPLDLDVRLLEAGRTIGRVTTKR